MSPSNLGNVWHIPANPEPPGAGLEGMRTPVFPTASSKSVTVWTGNQFAGGGNPGNQLEAGSAVLFRSAPQATWGSLPLTFTVQLDNNKYYSARIPVEGLPIGSLVQYYFRIAYDDHDTTFLRLNSDEATSLAVADESAAQTAPFSFSIDTAAIRGSWSTAFALPNVAIHAHVLPTGDVLMWGRRDAPDQSLDVDPPSPLQPGSPTAEPATCTPFIWSPSTGQVRQTPAPMMADGLTRANLFCSGHAFLPDGRLLVAGGHLADGCGMSQTAIYDPVGESWSASAVMKNGRWYPTLSTLPDGGVLIIAGSFRGPDGKPGAHNIVPELWRDGALSEILQNPNGAFDLYPRLHVASNGFVITTGSLQQTWSLDISAGGRWAAVGTGRINGQRDYAPSVLYDIDKAIYIGGGSPPTSTTELADIAQPQPNWKQGAAMAFPRRQHNATILADGTVLVTGGTRSGGSAAPENFNNLDPGQPVHVAELWDPNSNTWTELAAESTDRCYHSIAVLLPDASVLSAGGGEFFPIEGTAQQNDPADSHRDAQVFSPPYLFKGTRPVISAAPDTMTYGESLHVSTMDGSRIEKVTWIRLSSVTHSFNTGQRFASLSFVRADDGLDIEAPSSANVCPPGHYMLFAINQQGVPSVAKIIRLSAVPTAVSPAAEQLTVGAPAVGLLKPQDVFSRRQSVLASATGTRVVVGLTGTCPYGIAACWGGANEALHHLDGVEHVDPIPNGGDSTATVFLKDTGLPPLPRWRERFHAIVNDSYRLRGVEVTLVGPVVLHGDALLIGDSDRPAVRLAPLNPANKVQWDGSNQRPQQSQSDELDAFSRLASQVDAGNGNVFSVTGPLEEFAGRYILEVRKFMKRGEEQSVVSREG